MSRLRVLATPYWAIGTSLAFLGVALARVIGPAGRFQRVPQIAPGSHHFADSVACAKLAAELAKRSIRHASHGRHEQAVSKKERADLHGNVQ